MAQIEVRGLGANEIRIGRRRITPATEVVFALAFYLCVRSGERITRDEVVEVFWGTGDVTKGRHSLRQMLYKLRQRGFELDEDGEELYLGPSRLTSDVWEALQDSWSDEASVASLETSLDLVPALTKGVSPRFHEWLDSLRARLGAQHRRAAIRHLHQARREGRWSDLDRIALLMLRTDPLNEEATLARAESAAMIGSKALALEILDQYMEELGEKAPRIGLPATVLRRRIAERTEAWNEDDSLIAPLHGREDEVRSLVHLLERAGRGHGSAAVLYGAGGAGKTRLIDEALSIAQLSGFACVSVKTESSHSTRPIATYLAVARELIGVSGASGANPAAYALLRRLSELHPASSDSSLADAPSLNHESVSWALTEVLDAISAERRLIVCVDDLHKAHRRSISLLCELFSSTRELRLMWLVGARPEESAAPLLESDASVTIRVNPLAPKPARDLASHFLRRGHAATDQEASAIVKLSGGSPFFIRETALHFRRNSSSQLPPESLVELMGQRLSALSERNLTVLRAANLLGSHATVGSMSQVTGHSLTDLAECVERLELEGIVSFSHQKRIELHDCWSAVVVRRWSQASRAALALRCAQVMESEHATSPSMALARSSSELFRGSGDVESARRMLEAAANDAFSAGLYGESVVCLTDCLADTRNVQLRLRVLSRRAVAYHAVGDYESAVKDCELALQATGERTPTSKTAHTIAYAVLTDSLWRLGRDNSTAIQRLADVAQDPSIDPVVKHHACLMALRAVFSVRNSDYADHFAEVARSETARSGATVYGEQCALIFAAERANSTGVLEADARLDLLCSSGAAPAMVVRSLQNRTSALRLVGELDLALLRVNEAIRLSEWYGFLEELGAAFIKACYIALDACDTDLAKEYLGRSSVLPYPRQSEQNRREHNHAEARLLLQIGDAAGCLGVYKDCLEEVRSDASDRRRAVVGSCLALASAMTGKVSLAEQLLDLMLGTIEADLPGRFMDYPLETACRALFVLGRDEEANKLLKGYAARRRSIPDGGPVPFLAILRSELAVT